MQGSTVQLADVAPSGSGSEPSFLDVSAGRVDLTQRRVLRDGQEVPLTPLEFRLLSFLARRGGQIVSREELLQQVWNYRAGVETRTVTMTLRRLREKVERHPDRPVQLLTVRGHGYRFATPRHVLVPERVEACKLAWPTDRFFGREPELASIRAAFEGGTRLVTLLGPPGVGKSRLALELLRGDREVAGLVALVAARSRGDLLATLAGALGLELRGEMEAQIQVALEARGTEVLVIDQAEHLVEDLLPLLADWMARARVRFVVTSRRRLGLPGELPIRLAPLGRVESRALFLDRMRGLRGPISPTPGDLALVDRITDRLDGLPLSVELAAGLTGVCTLEQVLEGAARPLALRSLSEPDGPQQQSLRQAIDASIARLPARARSMLAELTVFAGGATLEALGAVATPEDGGHTSPWLQALVDHSLVTTREVSSRVPLRFELLQAVRERAAEDLLDPTPARDRHAAYFLRYGRAQAAKAYTRDGPAAIDALDRERSELLASHHHDLALNPTRAAEMALVLDVLLTFRGPLALQRDLLETTAGALADDLPEPLLGRLLRARGMAKLWQAELSAAMSDFRRALFLATAGGDTEGQAWAESAIGLGWFAVRDHVQARTAFLASRGHCRRLQAPGLEGAVESLLGLLLTDAGDYVWAARHFDRGRALLEAAGDPLHCAVHAAYHGFLLRRLKDHDASLDSYALATELAREAGATRLEGCCKALLAATKAAAGTELAQARELLADAQRLLARAGDQLHMLLVDLGEAHLRLAESRQAGQDPTSLVPPIHALLRSMTRGGAITKAFPLGTPAPVSRSPYLRMGADLLRAELAGAE